MDQAVLHEHEAVDVTLIQLFFLLVVFCSLKYIFKGLRYSDE